MFRRALFPLHFHPKMLVQGCSEVDYIFYVRQCYFCERGTKFNDVFENKFNEVVVRPIEMQQKKSLAIFSLLYLLLTFSGRQTNMSRRSAEAKLARNTLTGDPLLLKNCNENSNGQYSTLIYCSKIIIHLIVLDDGENNEHISNNSREKGNCRKENYLILSCGVFVNDLSHEVQFFKQPRSTILNSFLVNDLVLKDRNINLIHLCL